MNFTMMHGSTSVKLLLNICYNVNIKPLSPLLFNVYTNEITVKWNHEYIKALVYQPIQYKQSTFCSHVLTDDSADNLKRVVVTLQKLVK